MKWFEKDVGSIGIGAMIVFIAMVLVAGIAASVLIQTSTRLETQAMKTGAETTAEVATGIAVFDVLGYTTSSTTDISKIVIGVRPRAGSAEIDMNQVFVELSDSTTKVLLNYSNGRYLDTDGFDAVFAEDCFPDFLDATGKCSSRFGILVIEDADDSMSNTAPVMNRGDKAYICVNTTGTHTNLSERTDIWGIVVPEEGAPGMLSFTTPASYTDRVLDLQ
jgi:flagellin FlaB